jgi:hypothetical protein
MSRTKFKVKNKQRAIVQKLSNVELWFLYTAHLLNEICLPTKLHVDTSCCFKVMSRTKIADGRTKRRLYAHPSDSIKIANSNAVISLYQYRDNSAKEVNHCEEFGWNDINFHQHQISYWGKPFWIWKNIENMQEKYLTCLLFRSKYPSLGYPPIGDYSRPMGGIPSGRIFRFEP